MPELTLKQAIDLAWQHFAANDFTEAESICRQVLAIDPNFPDALNCLGMIALTLKHLDPAAELLGRAVQLAPQEPKFHHNLAEALVALDRLDEAVPYYERAIEAGNFPLTYTQLGNVLVHLGCLHDAVAMHRRAIELDPNFAQAHSNLGLTLQALGRCDEAIEKHRDALRINPSLHAVHSLLLYAMHLTTTHSPQEICDEHREWARRHTANLPVRTSHPNDRSPDRKLRIGYVSPELMDQPVGRFLLPLIENLDRSQFEVVCFSAASRFDLTSEKLSKHASAWHSITNLNDAQLDELIRTERIDILVDLASHTINNRLLAFARKPAPLQVTCIGYPDTTGLGAIDYRLVDAISDPPGMTDAFCTEKLVRLPRCFLCFSPPDAPPVAPLPALTNKFITFGSFNYFAKVSPEIIRIWARVLDAVPSSRLLIKSRYHLNDADRADAMQRMASHGLSERRVTILPRESNQQSHLSAYSQIDIALDTFPYNGTTTTCESLWMGVPVITLAGETHVSRVGASLLSACGLAIHAATTEDEYIQLAANLAADVSRLAHLRNSMRETLQNSDLMNGRAYADAVGNAYREMWREYCSRG